MQTDQFDDEFQKKLLGINPVTDEDEVDRIHRYITSNGKHVSHFSWGKFLLYGLASSLLISSLTFNYIQDRTNKALFSSLDSLKTHLTYLDSQSSEKLTLRVDTVFIDRYIEKAPLPQEFLYSQQDLAHGLKQKNDDATSGIFLKNTSISRVDSVGNTENKRNLPLEKAVVLYNLSKFKKTASSGKNDLIYDGLTTKIIDKNGRFIQTNDSNLNSMRTADSSEKATLDNPSVKYAEAGPLNRTWLISELSRIGKINPRPISLKLPKLKLPLKVMSYSKDKPGYYSKSIKSILKKMEYYVGGSFDAGHSQIGGSLLGEVRITPKWNFQTGIRLTQVTGDGYFTAEQYSQQTGQDFRTLYAPYVAQNVDLLNIDQNYQLLQIPLTIAYHHEIFPKWTLRFGLGTDLSISVQKHIHFDYKENNLSFDQGEYNAKLAVQPFNDLTLNVGLERCWNKFLFRLSPYVTSQLIRTEYFKDELSWGARAQVLYKFR